MFRPKFTVINIMQMREPQKKGVTLTIIAFVFEITLSILHHWAFIHSFMMSIIS